MLGFNVFTPPTPITTAAIKVLEEFPKFKSKYHPKFKSKYEYRKKSKKSTRVPKVLEYDRSLDITLIRMSKKSVKK